MIDINERERINTLLTTLSPTAAPAFGQMSAQNMVEHLATTMSYSNGKEPQPLMLPLHVAEKMKKNLLYTDMEIPVGFKAPMLGDTPPPLMCADFPAAILWLQSELDQYFAYTTAQPDIQIMHPTLGPLTVGEMHIFHNKHFTHHFKQFNLL